MQCISKSAGIGREGTLCLLKLLSSSGIPSFKNDSRKRRPYYRWRKNTHTGKKGQQLAWNVNSVRFPTCLPLSTHWQLVWNQTTVKTDVRQAVRMCGRRKSTISIGQWSDFTILIHGGRQEIGASRWFHWQTDLYELYQEMKIFDSHVPRQQLFALSLEKHQWTHTHTYTPCSHYLNTVREINKIKDNWKLVLQRVACCCKEDAPGGSPRRCHCSCTQESSGLPAPALPSALYSRPGMFA